MRDFPMWVGGQAMTTARTYDLHLPYDGSATARVAEGDESNIRAGVRGRGTGRSAMAALSNAERSDLCFAVASLF